MDGDAKLIGRKVQLKANPAVKGEIISIHKVFDTNQKAWVNETYVLIEKTDACMWCLFDDLESAK